MLKFTAYIFALMTLIFWLVVMGMMVIGQSSGRIIAAIVTSPVPATISDASRLHLIDIQHGLRLTSRFPLESVRDIRLHHNRPEALLLVQQIRLEGNRSELYHFDLMTGKIVPLFISRGGIPVRTIADTSAWWSPDGRLVTFYHPIDSGVYVTDLETQVTSLVVEVQIVPQRLFNFISWSPDGSQLIIRHQQNSILVVSLDGSNLREFTNIYPEDASAFLRTDWLSGSQRILLHDPATNEMKPIRVIDAETGVVHPLTVDLEGMSLNWSCDRDLLFYIHRSHSPQLQTDLYVLNLEDSTHTNLSEHPVLAGQLISYSSWSENCEWLIIGGALPQTPVNISANSGFPLAHLYIADPSGQEVWLINEAARVVRASDEIVYMAASEDNPQMRKIYSLVPGTETQPQPLTEEFPDIYQWMTWLGDWSWALFFETVSISGSSRLGVVDIQTGKVRYLLDEGEHIFTSVLWR